MTHSRSAVPYLSQYDESVPEVWRPHACTVVNLYMALRAPASLSVGGLIEEAVALGGVTPRGWKHDTIVALAIKHGVKSHREEFRSKDSEEEKRLADAGVQKIKRALEDGRLIIASMLKENGSYHTVLLFSTQDGGFTYHDPEIGPNLFITKKDFLRTWRKLAIFIGE